MRRRIHRSRRLRNITALFLFASTVITLLRLTRAVLQRAVNSPKLYVKPEFGLGNRFRALAYGAALAQATQRRLVVVWVRDEHMHAALPDLFTPPREWEVTERDVKSSLPVGRTLFYDHIEDGGTWRVIQDQMGVDIYVRSAFLFRSVTNIQIGEIRKWFQLFVERANPSIKKEISHFNLQHSAVSQHRIGVHIRAQNDLTIDVPHKVTRRNSILPTGAEIVLQKRKMCTLATFSKQISSQMSVHPSAVFLVAADKYEILVQLKQKFGARILSLNATQSILCARRARDRRCVLHAFAEMVLLSKSASIIYSHWSSFSEVIIHLTPSTEHLSGCAVEKPETNANRAHLGKYFTTFAKNIFS
jgi:hypothetical protein